MRTWSAIVVVTWYMTAVGCGELEVQGFEGTQTQETAALSDGSLAVHPPNAFTLGGQSAWFHDEGMPYGYFHTYDALKACGSGDAARKVHVFLPRDYESRRTRYPVVYMNDGDTTFWPGGAANKSWQVGETLGDLSRQRLIEDVIVVAIHPIDREREYTHTSWAPGRACCGLDDYSDYVADCVKTFIDTHYHTDARASRTAIVGSSHGGLASFHAATRRPDAFGRAGSLSPSFWAGMDFFFLGGSGSLATSSLVRGGADTLSRASRPTLWIDWGLQREGGFHNDTIEAMATSRGREMVSLLQRSYGYMDGETLHWHEDPVGGHDEDAWAWRFGLMMQAFYAR